MHHNVWEFTGLCCWSTVEQYAMTSKTFRESNTVNQIFTVDQVSLLLPTVGLFSIYHKVFLRDTPLSTTITLHNYYYYIFHRFPSFRVVQSSTNNSKLKTFNHVLRTFLYVLKCTIEFPKAKSRQFSLYCCWRSRPFPFTVDVSFVCLLLGAIFVRDSVVLEVTNFFCIGFPYTWNYSVWLN